MNAPRPTDIRAGSGHISAGCPEPTGRCTGAEQPTPARESRTRGRRHKCTPWCCTGSTTRTPARTRLPYPWIRTAVPATKEDFRYSSTRIRQAAEGLLIAMTNSERRWTFLSNHARVLPRLRTIAAACRITERAVQAITIDLEQGRLPAAATGRTAQPVPPRPRPAAAAPRGGRPPRSRPG